LILDRYTLTAKRILVIDDGPDIRLVAKAGLRKVGGWEVLTAASGSEGIAEAAAQRPDAILLDVMMPDMDGPATARRLQASAATCDIPVILMTALAEEEHRELAGLGVRGVISKPFDPARLHAQVVEILGSHATESVQPETSDSFLSAELAQIWERFRETNMERLAVLEETVMALMEGCGQELRQRAMREAHKLAGAAGSFVRVSDARPESQP